MKNDAEEVVFMVSVEEEQSRLSGDEQSFVSDPLPKRVQETLFSRLFS